MSNEEQHKIVNVHGVRFDISSILNDVTASIQNNIKKSLDGALKDYELYKSTHDAILQIPFVRELYIQNQELISQLEMLEHPNSHSEPIQLKIDELSPQLSPIVMHSYFQIDSHDDIPFTKNTNKILSSDSEGEEEAQEEDSENSEESESAESADQEEEVSASEKEEESADQEEEEVSASEEEEVSASEVEEQEEVEQEEEKQVEEQEEEEVYEIVIKNITYFTTNENDGDIYSCVDGDVGEIVGKFKNKKPSFMKRK